MSFNKAMGFGKRDDQNYEFVCEIAGSTTSGGAEKTKILRLKPGTHHVYTVADAKNYAQSYAQKEYYGGRVVSVQKVSV